MTSGKATVKAVLSGDTVTLIGNATNGPPPEMNLTLASLQAPKLSRNDQVGSEPFGFESWEYLRKLLIGKVVSFKVEYTVKSISRQFGSLYLEDQNVCVLVAQQGWCKVKSMEQSRDGVCCDYEEMVKEEENAKEQNLGIWQSGSLNAQIVYGNEGENKSLFESLKGNKTVEGVVDGFRDGASMRLLLKDSMRMVNFGLAGIVCPRVNNAKNGVVGEPAPYALQAKYFSETRLLHRDVVVVLEGMDNFGNMYGTIVHKKGNISVELLKNGFAKMVDWSAAFLPSDTRSSMRNAERMAKNQKVRVWANFKPSVVQSASGGTGMVIEVCSGDTIVVAVDGKNEKRISLSSIRAPRLGNARKGEADAPYALEAKEYLRSKTIGKQVKVTVDYERQPAEGAVGAAANVRTFGTICLQKTKGLGDNIATFLLQEGLAEVVRHREDDERSSQYDVLLDAEAKGKSNKKGLHSGKEAPAHRHTDLSTDSVKAKQYLPFLKREKVLKCVVEFVASGTRMKLFVPKENCVFNFSVAGIRCPQPSRLQGGKVSKPSEPFGEESRSFARQNLMQRNVLVEIEDMDRGGTIFGPLFIQGANKVNYGTMLLETGLATIDDYSIERTRQSSEYKNASDQAKSQRKNIWKNDVTKAPEPAANLQKSLEVMQVQASEIVSGSCLYLNKLPTTTLNAIEAKMAQFTKEKGIEGSSLEAKRGSLCAALFEDSSGSLWNRARIEAINGSSYRVRYIDYGNLATVPIGRLRPLEPTMAQYPPQAIECTLAFLRSPEPEEEYGEDAGIALSQLSWGKNLVAKICRLDDKNRPAIALYDNDVLINAQLALTGSTRIQRTKQLASHERIIYNKILEAQSVAKKKRLLLWRYGDIESDEDL